MTNTHALKYSDVCLVPNKCTVNSRQEVDTRVTLGTVSFKLPIVPSNMVCSIDEFTSNTLCTNGYFYVYHRFNDTLQFCRNKQKRGMFISISVGVKDADRALLVSLKSEGITPNYVTIDIAHGHADSVARMIEFIKTMFPGTFVIAGNVATPDGITFLEKAGADATKVGIGQGKACTTKLKTGFTVPMFTCVQECSIIAEKPIIADGGIEHNGDIAKALVAGATMVMAGGLFARLSDSPAYHRPDGSVDYFGSASAANKEKSGAPIKNIEGTIRHLHGYGLTYLEKMKEIQEDLQSAVSYAGGNCLRDLMFTNWYTTNDN